MYEDQAKIACKISSPVGTIWLAGKMKPCSPVSRNSTPIILYHIIMRVSVWMSKW
jgi:hypothetical protein